MHYILMIVFLHGYGPRSTVVMQEFNNEQQCKVAAASIQKAWRGDGLEQFCIPKG